MGKLTDILNGADYPVRHPEPQFRPPNVQMVAAYCRERGNGVDPRAFVDHYTAKGWRIGKSPMRDWRAAVRTWEARDASRQASRETAIRDVLAQHAVWDAWRDMPDGPEKYQAYLCSPDWGKLWAIVTERSGGKCERCKVNDAASVHHLTYQRKYQELPEDLIHYCQGCHDYTHGKSEVDPLQEAYKGQRQLEGIGPREAFGDDSLVTCPYCGCENCHLGTVVVDGENLGNQGCVVIKMYCESNCEWEMVFAGHKGTLSACVRNGRSIPWED